MGACNACSANSHDGSECHLFSCMSWLERLCWWLCGVEVHENTMNKGAKWVPQVIFNNSFPTKCTYVRTSWDKAAEKDGNLQCITKVTRRKSDRPIKLIPGWRGWQHMKKGFFPPTQFEMNRDKMQVERFCSGESFLRQTIPPSF